MLGLGSPLPGAVEYRNGAQRPKTLESKICSNLLHSRADHILELFMFIYI